jgi:alkanesulfonate monooxygenase SsuD/methylene tetrahydromethanopterin reductase-like flavin-dependent oxidoreductase (luciferase family)
MSCGSSAGQVKTSSANACWAMVGNLPRTSPRSGRVWQARRPRADDEGEPTVFMMRFDMRAPTTGAPATELYAAALEMAAWGESRGCISAVLCEHHASEDGYLPTPLMLASAMAARTTTLPIMVAVVLLPLYDPVRLAEEMVVLDNISGGRVSYVAAIGYRPVEYEMFGVDFHRRGRIAEEKLELLLKAKTGEPFVHEGRNIHVTPPPVTPDGPMVAWGGGSAPAARRAGRFGIGFLAQGGGGELEGVYQEARRWSRRPPPSWPRTSTGRGPSSART